MSNTKQTKALFMRMQPATHDLIKKQAEKENRSVSNLITNVMENYCKDQKLQ